MDLQKIIDTVNTEIDALRKAAEDNLHYCKGASDTLKRVVDLCNAPKEQSTDEPETKDEFPKE